MAADLRNHPAGPSSCFKNFLLISRAENHPICNKQQHLPTGIGEILKVLACVTKATAKAG
jgi:hypothetical protein